MQSTSFGPGGATDVSLEDGRRAGQRKQQPLNSLAACSDAQASSMLSTTTYSTTWYYTLR
eukprot:scaffold20422_cov133-Skeletonema_marinoi.AAC.1